MVKKIPNSFLAFTTAFFLAIVVGCPAALAFSSGRTSPAQNQIDLLASNEDLVKELNKDIGGPDFSGINSVDDAMKVLNAFITQLAEDFAEDATKKCSAQRIPVDYNGVKKNLVDCLTNTVEIISSKAIQISVSFNVRKAEFEHEMQSVQETLMLEKPLTTQQKQFITKNIFNPICSTLIPAMNECDDPKYAVLAQANQCKADAEKDGEEYIRRAVKDVCRNDGAWVFDFLDAKPLKCAEAYQNAAKSDAFQECDRYFDDYKGSKNKPGQTKRLDSGLEFCNFTGKAGDCMRELLVNSCHDNPGPGQVLLDTFKDTRSFWSAKCGACATGAAFWPMFVLCLLVILIQSGCWNKN